MRLAVFALLLISTPGFAQQGHAVEPLAPGQPVPFTRPPAGTSPLSLAMPKKSEPSPASAAELSKYYADVKKCVSNVDPLRNPVTVNVKISADGKIIGEPDPVSPIDSDEFRNDVATVVARLHQCEPLKVPPSQDNKGFTQQFIFKARNIGVANDRAIDATAGKP
jgi:hypothetical protein